MKVADLPRQFFLKNMLYISQKIFRCTTDIQPNKNPKFSKNPVVS